MPSSTEERAIAFKHTLDVLHERTDRQWFEETFGTRHAVVGPEIWQLRPSYNDAASAVLAGIAVEEVDFELTLDPFSANTTWFAKTNPGVWPYSGPLTDFDALALERVQNWISPVVFGPSSSTGYSYQLTQGDGTPIPTGNWQLRFVEGVLKLDEGFTAVDNGWVTPLRLTAYRYTGPLGLGAGTVVPPIVQHTPVVAAQELNWGNGPIHEVNLEASPADVTLSLTNPVEGTIYRVLAIQHNTEVRDFIWPGNVEWATSGGTPPAVGSEPDSISLYSLLYDGTNYIGWANIPEPPPNVYRATCLSAAAVGDVVYASGPAVDGVYQVQKADPRDEAKMPAIGVIIAKQSATRCWVQHVGEMRGVYTGLSTNDTLFVGSTGGLESVPPPPLVSGYSFVQAMGTVVGADTVLLTTTSHMVKRVGS